MNISEETRRDYSSFSWYHKVVAVVYYYAPIWMRRIIAKILLAKLKKLREENARLRARKNIIRISDYM